MSKLISKQLQELAAANGFIKKLCICGNELCNANKFTTTQTELQAWFREKHDIEIWIIPTHLHYEKDKSYKAFIEFYDGEMVNEYEHPDNRKYTTSLEAALLQSFNYIRTKLEITGNQSGGFYKAKIDGVEIHKKDIYKLLDIEQESSFRLEYHVNRFKKANKNYKVLFFEMDVS